MSSRSTDGFSVNSNDSKRPNHSNSMHLRTSKSKTLHKANRKTKSTDMMVQTRALPRKKPDVTKHIENTKRTEVVTKFKVTHTFTATEPKTVKKTKKKIEHKLTSADKKEHIIKSALNDTPARDHKFSTGFKIPQFSTVVSTVAAAILLVGYITYLNIPNISLRVAASKAGIDAQLPNYDPPGFDFDGPVAYSSGEISLKYQSSNNNSMSYSLVQKKSNWDSQSLQTNYVEVAGADYTVHETNGLTIYSINNGEETTWVSGGIWYTLNDNAELSQEQLLNIATSI